MATAEGGAERTRNVGGAGAPPSPARPPAALPPPTIEGEVAVAEESDIDTRLAEAEREWRERVERAMRRKLDGSSWFVDAAPEGAPEKRSEERKERRDAQAQRNMEITYDMLCVELPNALRRCYSSTQRAVSEADDLRHHIVEMWNAPTAYDRALLRRASSGDSAASPHVATRPMTPGSKASGAQPRVLTPAESRKAALELLMLLQRPGSPGKTHTPTAVRNPMGSARTPPGTVLR